MRRARGRGVTVAQEPSKLLVPVRVRSPALGRASVSQSHGAWRSLVAHSAGGRKVAGSNPVAPISPGSLCGPGRRDACRRTPGGASPMELRGTQVSCAVAYSDRPTASRASSTLAYICILTPVRPGASTRGRSACRGNSRGLRTPALVDDDDDAFPGVDVVLDLELPAVPRIGP